MWVIEHTPYMKFDVWMVVSANAIKESTDLYGPTMKPRSFEDCLAAALAESQWNSGMQFRFRNIETGEVIPFELFPEIDHT